MAEGEKIEDGTKLRDELISELVGAALALGQLTSANFADEAAKINERFADHYAAKTLRTFAKTLRDQIQAEREILAARKAGKP